MRNAALSVFIAFASLQPVSEAAGDVLRSLSQDPQPTEVLAGRIYLRLPTGARQEPLVQSIMHAPESQEDQSRIVIDAGAERLIIMVYELFAQVGDDFAASLRMRKCPGIYFTTELAGRTAKIAGTGLAVWEVLRDYLVDRDVDGIRQAFGQHSQARVPGALMYGRRYPEEIRVPGG